MLRGLFIGIDRYAAPVTRLSCARADALALASIFADGFDQDVTMLLDDDATLEGIRGGLEAIAGCDEEDLVVVSFSGHGTESHQLVPVDVHPDDLDNTCLSLVELAEILDRIPAKQMLVILDCCFSGGFGGARVFATQQARSVFEDRGAVQALAKGGGRVVVTASGAGEPALETAQLGHGLLTAYLLKGLQGPEELVDAGRIQLLKLIDFTMREVGAAAERLNETQTPTLYGSVEGAPSLPVLVPGTRYAAAFPDRVRAPVNKSWASLLPYGFSEVVIEAWAKSMISINELQRDAINQLGVLDGESALVIAPTGSGKTMIGELAALRSVSAGGRAVMLLPLKALVNDKFEYVRRTYGDALSVVQATGDHGDDVPAILSAQYDLALLTYEKFLNLMLVNPFIMRGVDVVVIDEVQMMADPGRGASLEFLLTLLRAGHGRGGAPQLIALSAVVGDPRGLDRWLGGRLLRSEVRPVPLREHVVDAAGNLRTREADGSETSEARFIVPAIVGGSQSNKPWIIPLLQRLVREGKKVIVFRATKGDTVGSAIYLGQALGLNSATDVLAALPTQDLSTSSAQLRSSVERGVGFHNADLDRAERVALEEAFRDRTSPLRVLVATTTLAMGVNTPAECVVIAGLQHPGSGAYSIAEYKNMVGRAGRPGYADAGEAFVIAATDIGPAGVWQHYVLGRPEDLSSQFINDATDPQTLALRCLVALGSSVSEDALVELLESSFAVWQRREAGLAGWDVSRLRHDLDLLVQAQLVDREPNGLLTLTALGRYAGESGVEVRSVTQVASALRGVHSPLGLADILTLAQVTVELDGLRIRYHAKSTKERMRWPNELIQHGAQHGLINLLHVGGGQPTLRAKRAAACLLFLSNNSLADIERHLLQHTPANSAAGEIRAIAARTRDVIDAVAQIAQFHGQTIADDWDSAEVGLRLEIGLPESVIELARKLGRDLTRGQYLSLANAGITSWDAVRGATTDRLEQLVGEATTRRLRAALPSDSH